MTRTLLILLLAIFSGRPAQATAYYVSSTGDDAQAGTSPTTAWRSVARASAQHYGPGDQLLFQGGQTFAGSLWLRSSQGTPARPILISSYGAGRATIASGTNCGFYGHNMAGIELRRLAFVGAGRLSSASAGVSFYLDSAQTELRYLRLDSLDVSGYRNAGITIGSWNGTSGYTDGLPGLPGRGAALDLQAEFSLSAGPRDLLGNPTPLAPVQGNLGALEDPAGPAPALPVALSEFSAERWGPAALLRWTTASEQHNAFFAIESSPDGDHFSLLDQMPGHGDSPGPQTYEYADLNLARYASSTVHYRLRQVDGNGQATYSPVRVLTGVTVVTAAAVATGPRRLQVAPNPAAASAPVLVKGKPGTQVQLLDGRGQLVGTTAVGPDGTAGLPVAGLAAGLYLVRCGKETARLVLTN